MDFWIVFQIFTRSSTGPLRLQCFVAQYTPSRGDNQGCRFIPPAQLTVRTLTKTIHCHYVTLLFKLAHLQRSHIWVWGCGMAKLYAINTYFPSWQATSSSANSPGTVRHGPGAGLPNVDYALTFVAAVSITLTSDNINSNMSSRFWFTRNASHAQ